MKRSPRTPRLLVAALVPAAFLAGLAADHAASAARKTSEPYRPLDVFADVLAHVENSYVEDVSERDLVYGAIDGLVARLDPHSAFLRPEAFKAMREETSGEFDGLGLEVTIRDGQLTVVAPFADSPGERAGIRPGDRIVSIDGASTKDMTLTEAIRRMKGSAGTKSVLEVMRDGFTAPQKLTLVRDRIRTQSVDMRVLDGDRAEACADDPRGRVDVHGRGRTHAVPQAIFQQPGSRRHLHPTPLVDWSYVRPHGVPVQDAIAEAHRPLAVGRSDGCCQCQG